MSNALNNEDAEYLLKLSPGEKWQVSLQKIREWIIGNKGNVYVSFSGGKDSTVLAYLVCEAMIMFCKNQYDTVKLVFSDTGLEYPEIKKHVRFFADWLQTKFPELHISLDVVHPKMRFDNVISTYGYPLIGKEVAEAIYYARRIRSQSVQVERERERENKRSKENGTFGEQSRWKRLEIVGGRIEGNRAANYAQLCKTSTARNRQTILLGKMPGAGVKQTGETGEGGVFSNAEEQFGEKSRFNKEKWLPLARDVPVQISHMCCGVMKKSPLKKYQHSTKTYPLIATMADESRVRRQAWLRTGCNAFDGKQKMSKPMSFWSEQDVLKFIVTHDIPICSVYGDIVCSDGYNEYSSSLIDMPRKCTGCSRTGCVYCAFGAHLDKGQSRFQMLSQTHPRQYEYCIGGGQWVDNPSYDPTASEWDGEWKNWNPKQIWVPSKEGLGMGKVFDMCNEIYGKDFIRYE